MPGARKNNSPDVLGLTLNLNNSEKWRPSAQIETLRLRAALLKKIRLFFDERNVLEVETPCLSCAATTDPYIDSFVVNHRSAISSPESSVEELRYLHTSPEMPMKRLLAAGSGSIYQVCKVFRQGEQGRFHNSEFTMLEWYRPGMTYRELMEEVGQLIMYVLPEKLSINSLQYISYREAFEKSVNVDPFTASTKELVKCAVDAGIGSVPGLSPHDRDGWLHLLLTHCVEPGLGKDKLSFLFDFPASQASLAHIREGDPAIAERFELYVDGVELANGFQELINNDTQRSRFQHDLRVRKSKSLGDVPFDNNMLHALAHGLPDCSGVALGVDRLLMIMLGAERIEQVISFSFEQA